MPIQQAEDTTECRACQHSVDHLFVDDFPDPSLAEAVISRQLSNVPPVVAVLDLAIALTVFVYINEFAAELLTKVLGKAVDGGLIDP